MFQFLFLSLVALTIFPLIFSFSVSCGFLASSTPQFPFLQCPLLLIPFFSQPFYRKSDPNKRILAPATEECGSHLVLVKEHIRWDFCCSSPSQVIFRNRTQLFRG